MDPPSEEDVLSLSVHEERETGDESEASAMDLTSSEFIVLDETRSEGEQQDPAVPDDVRLVVHEGLAAMVCHSSGALGPVESGTDDDAIGEAAAQMVCSSSRAICPAEESDSRMVVSYKSRVRQCSICGLPSREKMRRHVLREHLPFFWYGSTACWDCEIQETQASSMTVRHTKEHQIGCSFDEEHLHLWCQLASGSLHLVTSWLECDGLDSLLEYVLNRQLYTHVQSGFSELESHMLIFYVENYSPRAVASLSCRPPSHFICLTNWEIMASLLQRVESQRQREFLQHRAFLTYEEANVTEPFQPSNEPFLFVDSHFYIDLVLQRLRMRNFLHLNSVIAPSEGHGFYFGVANYVFPKHWSNWALQVGAARTVYVTFGIYPHIASFGVSEGQFRELDSLLGSHRCVAVGEIGLDYTTRCRCNPCYQPGACRRRMLECQEWTFRDILRLASRRKLPVVLHCRDNGDGTAAARAFDIIAQEGLTEMRFHRHCFMGSASELEQWRSLPKIVFGITAKFLKDSSDSKTDVARILQHQLVLESDAPYLSPYSCCPVNNPWNLRRVAEEVSRARNVPLVMLMEAVNGNALKFYGIPNSDPSQ
jgi:TatD DNase family protein